VGELLTEMVELEGLGLERLPRARGSRPAPPWDPIVQRLEALGITVAPMAQDDGPRL
jgi:hypothetical protein